MVRFFALYVTYRCTMEDVLVGTYEEYDDAKRKAEELLWNEKGWNPLYVRALIKDSVCVF